MPKVFFELEKEADILKTVEKQLYNIRNQVQEIVETKNIFVRDFCTHDPIQPSSSRRFCPNTKKPSSTNTMTPATVSSSPKINYAKLD